MRIILLFIFTIHLNFLSAQDNWFSFPGNSVNMTNPALVSDTAANVRLASRLQWPEFSPISFSTLNFSMYFPKLNNWIYAGGTYADENKVITEWTTYLGIVQQFNTGKKSSLRVGFETGFFQKKLNWDNLVFGDMIDPRRGIVYQSGDVPRGGIIGNFDFAAGIIFNWKNLFTGISCHHLTEPNESLTTGHSPIPKRIGFQIGGDFNLSNDSTNMRLQPYFMINYQDVFIAYQVGSRLTVQNFEFHFASGLNERFIGGGFGYRWNIIRFHYNMSLFPKINYGTAHEIGINFRFNSRSQKKNNFFKAGTFSSQ